MRFMIMVRANAQSESGAMPDKDLMAEMVAFHEQLARAGVLLDANGLKPSAQGFRVSYQAGKPTLLDGPFTETKELIAGYTLIQTRSREEAMEWARRFPAPFGPQVKGEIEVRQLFEMEDFASPGVGHPTGRPTDDSHLGSH
ncbi:YciI family protein [Ideonella sp. DXS29W]|uniref:YciI family protein n=1 Tax=Ideonella lacteola TaxID=2984193 RepID=A0ABU9BQ75_9BURK